MNNTVELLGYYGGDITHAQSAWTSTYRELTEEKKNRIPKLLKFLAENGHHTPFEKSSLHFLVTTDIASHIHLLKHRVGVSVNAESARYKELKEDNTYIPDDWNVNLPMDTIVDLYGMITAVNYLEERNLTWAEVLEAHVNESNKLYHTALEHLTPILGRKRAKESARFFKPYASQMTADVMFNFRAFAHFQNLRNKPDAQKEIKGIAEEMLKQVKDIEGQPFEHTLNAFNL